MTGDNEKAVLLTGRERFQLMCLINKVLLPLTERLAALPVEQQPRNFEEMPLEIQQWQAIHDKLSGASSLINAEKEKQ